MPIEQTLTFVRDVTTIFADEEGSIIRLSHAIPTSGASDLLPGQSLLQSIQRFYHLPDDNPALRFDDLKLASPLFLRHKENLQSFELIFVPDVESPSNVFLLRNVTDRELASLEASRSAEVLRSVLRYVPSGHWNVVLDRNASKVHSALYSKEMKALIGFADDELENKAEAWFARIHPEDQVVMLNLTRLKVGGLSPSFSTQYRIQHKHGHYVSLYTHDSITRSSGDQLVQWTGSVWDLSSLQEALLAAHRLAALVEASDCPIVGCDILGQITRWNRAAQILFGHSDRDILTLSLADLVSQDDRHVLAHHIKKVQIGTTKSPLEIMAINALGHTFPALISVSDMAPTSPNTAGFSVVIQDISSLKQVQQELIEAKIQADSASKAKNIFLANVSHEVRTPLAAIKGFAEVVDGYLDSVTLAALDDLSEQGRFDREQSSKLVKESSKLIRRVCTNVSTLERLINDILDVSKLEAGKLDFENKPFNLKAMVQDLCNQFTIEAQRKNLQFNFTWDQRIHRHVRSDEMRLRQILTNLLSNAFKYTLQGHVDFNVYLIPQADILGSQELMFRVRDTGVGIPEKNAKQLFQPFERGSQDTAVRFRGTGIGLFLSRHIAKELGGEVTILDTAVGIGSTFGFQISLPCTMKTAIAAPVSTAETQLLAGYRILVVEDNEDLRVLSKTILTNEGARVHLAVDGLDGLELAFKGDYDVILMDLQMPRMDGYEAVRLMKANAQCTAKVVAVTAHAMHGEREACMAAGFDDYLAKPMQRDLIIKTLLSLGPPQ